MPGTFHPEDPDDADRLVRLERNVEETRAMVEQVVEQQTRFLSEASREERGDEAPQSVGGEAPRDDSPGLMF